jgi:putative transposase
VQSCRNKKAAKQFFKKLLKGLRYVPRVVITDKLKSYAAAKREGCCPTSSTLCDRLTAS